MTTIDLALGDATLHARVDGPPQSPALVLWNGALCALPMWDGVVPGLVPFFRVIRFDIRGTGRSTVARADDDAQFRFERYAADVNALLDALGVARAHHWAMAWGSRVALAYAAWHPQRVITLALYDASIDPADVAAQKAGAARARAAQLAAGIPAFPEPEGWNRHDDPAMAQRAIAAARRITLEPLVAALTMPVLLATGDEDPNLASTRRIAQRLPHARLVVMDGVGHGSVRQRPDLTSGIFLRQQQAWGLGA